MVKRETELQKRVRKFKPLWDRQQRLKEQLESSTTEEEKDYLRKELGLLLAEMNKGDWKKNADTANVSSPPSAG